jgi:hypothetical protein
VVSSKTINNIFIGLATSVILSAGGMLIHHNSKISSQEVEIRNLKDKHNNQSNINIKLQDQISQIEVKIAEQKIRIDYIPENTAKYKKNYNVSGSKLTIDLREFKEEK